MDALISSWVDHVAFAADEADVDHVLRSNGIIPRRNTVTKLGEILRKDGGGGWGWR